MIQVTDLEIFRNKPVDNAVYFVTDSTLHEDIKLMEDTLTELEKEYSEVKFYILDAKSKPADEIKSITKLLPCLFLFNTTTQELSTNTGTYSQVELAELLNKFFGTSTNISLK